MAYEDLGIGDSVFLKTNHLLDDAYIFYEAIMKFLIYEARIGDPNFEYFFKKKYIFRGQANFKWHLVPASLREKWFLDKGITKENLLVRLATSFKEGNDAVDLDDACLAIEYSDVYNFLYYADVKGLIVPDYNAVDSNSFYSDIDSNIFYPFGKKFPYNCLFLKENGVALRHYAIAQHYGIPTRLLDWTDNPLVAIYMACNETIEHNLNSSNQYEAFSVWVMPTSVPLVQYSKKMREDDNIIVKENILSQLRVPYSNNKNMTAQSGLFTICPLQKINSEEEFPQKIKGVDEFTSEDIKGYGVNCDIFKISLVATECIKMMKILNAVGINASSVYPGYEGVKKYMDERKLYE